MTQPNLKVFLKDMNAKLPAYAHAGDSGLDLATPVPLRLTPFQRVKVDINVHVQLPPGHEAQVRGRSGLTTKGIVTCGGLGTVDNGFIGNIGVTLYWMPNLYLRGDGALAMMDELHTEMLFDAGDRIAQLVIAPVASVAVEQVHWLSDLSETERGESGFGSTGR